MAEEKLENLRSTVKSWVKGIITSIVGLVSVAVLMYLTPVVNNVIKPAKPLANFAAQVNGSVVEFNNRSNGGVQGWWDFGDGTALEPFDPKVGVVKHTYAKPGSYNVKLSLQNLIGDASDRTVPVTIDTADTSSSPEITDFALESITDDRVPAAYRIRCKTKNVNVCLVSYGDGRPPEFVNGVALDGRSVSFNDMGAYTVSIYAINGTQFIQKSADVYVGGGDERPITLKLTASYDAVQVERREKSWNLFCAWQADPNESAAAVLKERLADSGCTIESAVLTNADEPGAPIRNVNLAIAPDKSKIILTGELFKTGAFLAANSTLPHWLAKAKVVMEHRSAVQKFDRGELPMAVALNQTIKIPTQRPGNGWQIVREQVNLELWDGNHKTWSGNSAVTKVPMTLSKQACYLTILPQDDGFLVTVDAPMLPPTAPLPIVLPTPTPAAPPVVFAPPVVDPVAPAPPRFGPIRPASFERIPLLPQKKVGN